jgi:molybdopterin/thiamine biosynthesis adenylyltransferase
MIEEKLMSRKKPSFAVNDRLNRYLAKYNRNTKIPVFYDDLLRFSGSVVVYDQHEEDTFWVRCYYPDWEREEIDNSLKQVYTIMHSDGSDDSLEFLNVDAIDYCTFGNSKPFRVKVRNILNDSFTYFLSLIHI